MARRLSIVDAKQIAETKGGKCLSKTYINNKQKLLWCCHNGHEWLARLSQIKDNGTWCPKCNTDKSKNGIIVAQRIAKNNGGKCLSVEYNNNKTKMLWECKEGHVWESAIVNIKNNNHWCPYCAGLRFENGLLVAQKAAINKSGECISTEYVNSRTKMLWKCKDGHKWEAALKTIIRGHWCKTCFDIYKSEKLRDPNGLKIAQKIANEREGECLSNEYTNNTTKMTWKCGCGSIWKATLRDIKSGCWCPDCAQLKRAKSSSNSFVLYHWKTGEELVCVASYEKRVVEHLNINKINFEWQSKTFTTNILTKTGKLSTYRPDLYLCSAKKWIEIKGYFREDSRAKWNWFHKKIQILNCGIKINLKIWGLYNE